MIRRLPAAAAVLALMMNAGMARAATLGVSAPPALSSSYACSSSTVIGQYADDPSTPYVVPAAGREITQWQTYTAGDDPGSSLTFAVVRPDPGNPNGYTVVGSDTEALPNPLPAGQVASFTLSDPIPVQPGDTLALYSSDTADACSFDGGVIPATDQLFAATAPTLPLAASEPLTVTGSIAGGYALNVAATLVENEDAGVQTAAPAAATVGVAAVLTSTVTNLGPAVGPITFTDQVPDGLLVDSAVAGLGVCSTSGQTVTCTIDALPVGQSVPVDVVVTPAVAETVANSVSVDVGTASGNVDPTAANNAATASVVVVAPASPVQPQPAQPPASAPPSSSPQPSSPQPAPTSPPRPPSCTVIGLRGLPVTAASVLLRELSCRVRVVRAHGSLRRGLVVGTRQRPGAYPDRQLVTLIVSSGARHRARRRGARTGR